MGAGAAGAEGGVAELPGGEAPADALGAAGVAGLAGAADFDFWYLRVTWFT